jgi:hypothetical protein
VKLTAEVRGKLESYVKERETAWKNSQPKQAAIIATFLRPRV